MTDIFQRYAWLGVFVIWLGGILLLKLLHFDAYGIEEAAAQALLISWSAIEHIANPIVVLGTPDFRGLLFAPVGLYWPGSIVAVKVFGAIVAFLAAFFTFKWSQRASGAEAALIAVSLLLIAPATFSQINALGTGPYLLLLFGLGFYLYNKHIQSDRVINGWYFLQLLNMAVAASIHPAGLAYPAALAWLWKDQPENKSGRRQVWIGIGATVLFVLALRYGWYGMNWLSNPLASIATAFFGPQEENIESLGWGLFPAALLILILLFDGRNLFSDFMGRTLLLAIIIGLVAADSGWAYLAVTIILFRGVPLLILANSRMRNTSLVAQRGIVFVVVLVVGTAFMVNDRILRMNIEIGLLSSQDNVIRTLATELETSKEPVNTSSQWPARTMLATKHPAFPLPPASQDNEILLHNIKNVRYILLDPYDEANKELGANLAQLSGVTKTLAIEKRAVLLQVTYKDAAGSSQVAPAAKGP